MGLWSKFLINSFKIIIFYTLCLNFIRFDLGFRTHGHTILQACNLLPGTTCQVLNTQTLNESTKRGFVNNCNLLKIIYFVSKHQLFAFQTSLYNFSCNYFVCIHIPNMTPLNKFLFCAFLLTMGIMDSVVCDEYDNPSEPGNENTPAYKKCNSQ